MATRRLWDKGLPLDAAVHHFTVGEDYETDLALVEWDALASAAHARMLAKVGLLTEEQARALVDELGIIAALGARGEFVILPEQEDVHTAIEAALTERLGDAGRRIHTARSRNDQVIAALRLYMRSALCELGMAVARLAVRLQEFAEGFEDAPLPGYTHLRRAMPSSFGMWAVAYVEALTEELEALEAVDRRLDRCPLGGAAGFGTPLPIDREHTAQLLGFSRVQRSVVDVQSSRGRHELAVLSWLSSVAGVLEKLLWDIALYSTEEFGFLRLPDAFTTGSSIMPQKRNPDVIELARARCGELRGLRGVVEQIAGGLPSSYHRDSQLLKQPLFTGIVHALETFDVVARVIPGLTPNLDRAAAACGDELYAAQEAYRLVREEGLPFRDAYRVVGEQIVDGSFSPVRQAPEGSAHLGGLGALALDQGRSELEEQARLLVDRRQALLARWDAVWELGE